MALWSELTAVARTITAAESDGLDYMQPNYFQHFSHYASRLVEDSTPAQLTPRARDLLAGRGALFVHPWAQGFLQPRYLHLALSGIRSVSRLRAKPCVGDAVRLLAKSEGLSRDRALMHIMWLAKYDLITLGDGGPELEATLE